MDKEYRIKIHIKVNAQNYINVVLYPVKAEGLIKASEKAVGLFDRGFPEEIEVISVIEME